MFGKILDLLFASLTPCAEETKENYLTTFNGKRFGGLRGRQFSFWIMFISLLTRRQRGVTRRRERFQHFCAPRNGERFVACHSQLSARYGVKKSVGVVFLNGCFFINCGVFVYSSGWHMRSCRLRSTLSAIVNGRKRACWGAHLATQICGNDRLALCSAPKMTCGDIVKSVPWLQNS